jgi:succinylglutamate desuccinylase
MDEDSAELVRQLYTRICMEMEDASIIALELGAPQSTFDASDIAKLGEAAQSIADLVKATNSLQG